MHLVLNILYISYDGRLCETKWCYCVSLEPELLLAHLRCSEVQQIFSIILPCMYSDGSVAPIATNCTKREMLIHSAPNGCFWSVFALLLCRGRLEWPSQAEPVQVHSRRNCNVFWNRNSVVLSREAVSVQPLPVAWAYARTFLGWCGASLLCIPGYWFTEMWQSPKMVKCANLLTVVD